MQIVTISPKGQITIPVDKRQKLKKYKKFLLEMHGSTIILKPVQIKVIKDDLNDFSALANSSFEFWNNSKDDIYQNFYQ